MATITIRNLDDSTKSRLRVRAAEHDRSMEEEARMILKEALQEGDEDRGLGSRIHERFMSADGVELAPAARDEPPRRPESLK